MAFIPLMVFKQWLLRTHSVSGTWSSFPFLNVFCIICMMGGLFCWSSKKKSGWDFCHVADCEAWRSRNLWQSRLSTASDGGVTVVFRGLLSQRKYFHSVVLRSGRYSAEVCFLHSKPALVGEDHEARFKAWAFMTGLFTMHCYTSGVGGESVLRTDACGQTGSGSSGSFGSVLVSTQVGLTLTWHDDVRKDGRRCPTSSLMLTRYPGHDAVHTFITFGHLK